MEFQRLEFEEIDWDRLDAFPDRLVFQTREWIEFVADTQQAEPVLAALIDGSDTVGYFTGLLIRRYGFTILGSPMPGWTTAFMGFNLEAGVSRRTATEGLLEFAFGPLGCAHVELKDLRLGLEDVEGLGFDHSPWHGVEVDLKPSEEDLFAGFKGAVRTAVRKAEKNGVVVEEADPETFVDDFYPQVQDVFSKQGLVPPFDADRIRALIRHVHPSGRLLLVRARDAEGACVASAILPWMNGSMHFLAAASWREHQHLMPNEALLWRAMQIAKERGVEAFDLGGFMTYKRKWKGRDLHLPALRKSRSRRVARLRDVAQRAFTARQKLRGRLRS